MCKIYVKDMNSYMQCLPQTNNYIVRSYGDVIVVTKIATRRSSKEQSIVMY